jgi:predicted nuclease of predicted toxin-antitoxin system
MQVITLHIEQILGTDIGAANASDQEIMAYATQQNCIVLTHDQDFNTLLALSRLGKPSVVLLRLSSLRVDTTGQRVLRAIHAVLDDLNSGAIVVIEDSRVRVRSLPLINFE